MQIPNGEMRSRAFSSLVSIDVKGYAEIGLHLSSQDRDVIHSKGSKAFIFLSHSLTREAV